MRQIYSDHPTPEDQQIARRIYLGMATCYASLLLLLGVLVAFNLSSRGKHVLAFDRNGGTSRTGGMFSAVAAEMPDRAQCAAHDRRLLTSLEEHGEAQDVPADDLRAAFFALVKARVVCASGHVDEALALYDGVVIGSGRPHKSNSSSSRRRAQDGGAASAFSICGLSVAARFSGEIGPTSL